MKKLKYYAFDVDDNILHLKTPIYIEREKDGNRYRESITTMEYAKIRKDNDYKLLEDSFIHFSDVKNTFLDDVIYAIENKKFGPSWEEFINCIKNGHIFAIITARGHEPDTIKSAISYIIYNYLSTEEYDF